MRQPAPATEPDGGAIRNLVGSQSRTGSFSHDFELAELIGRGGTADVWRVIAPDGREAAMKLPRVESRDHPGAALSIRREFDVLRRVACDNVVEAYALIEHDSAPALVMECLPHGDLVPLLGAAPAHWLPAFRGVVTALLEAHRCGLAHGDVKARNVLFAADGSARLIDFSAACPLESPAAPSTPAYSLPAGLSPSARDADCFALAALLFELATGRLPYGLGGAADVADLPAVAACDPRSAPLLAVAVAALRAAGRVESPGYFLDVIESVHDVSG
jgi:serine/threonine protein kinase